MGKLYYQNAEMPGFEEPVEVTAEQCKAIFKKLGKPFTFSNEIKERDSGRGLDFKKHSFPSVLIKYINKEVGHALSVMEDIPPGQAFVGVYASEHSSSKLYGPYVLCVKDRETLKEDYFDAGNFANQMRFALYAPPSIKEIQADFDIDPKVALEEIEMANLQVVCQEVQAKESNIPFLPLLVTLDDQGLKKEDLAFFDYGLDFVNRYMEGTPTFFNKKTKLPFYPKLFIPKTYALKLKTRDRGYSTSNYITFERSKLEQQFKQSYLCGFGQVKDRAYFFSSSLLLDLQKRGKRAALLINPFWLPKNALMSEEDPVLLIQFSALNTRLEHRPNAKDRENIKMVYSPLLQSELIPEDLCEFLKAHMKQNNISEVPTTGTGRETARQLVLAAQKKSEMTVQKPSESLGTSSAAGWTPHFDSNPTSCLDESSENKEGKNIKEKLKNSV